MDRAEHIILLCTMFNQGKISIMKLYSDLHRYMWIFSVWILLAMTYWMNSGQHLADSFLIGLPSLIILILDWNRTEKHGVPGWYIILIVIIPWLYILLRAIKLRKNSGNFYLVPVIVAMALPYLF